MRFAFHHAMRLFCVSTLLLIACSSSSSPAPVVEQKPAPTTQPVDTAPTVNVDPLAPDPVVTLAAPMSLSVAEGEGTTVIVKVSPEDATLTATASEKLSVLVVDKGMGTFAVTVQSAYAGPPLGSLSLFARKGPMEKTQTVATTVQALKWGTRWNLKPEGVAEREHPSVLMDTARDRILVLGGSGYRPQGVPLSDAWQVSLKTGKAEKLVVQNEMLPAIGSMRAVAVPNTTTAYLFGGYGQDVGGGNTASDDLYLADYAGQDLVLEKVEQPQPSNERPAARSLHGVAYDEVGKRLFVFGGITRDYKMLDDLWVGQITGRSIQWSERKLATKPSKRYGFFFGQSKGRLFLFSGAQGLSKVNPARDLWELDLRATEPTYKKLLEGDAVPAGRRNGCFAMDEQRERLYIYGGTPDAAVSIPGLFVYDAREGQGRFVELNRPGVPPLRSSGSAIVDPRDGSTYFGFGNDNTIYADFTRFGL
jgi:hypothetical protein